MAAHEASQAAVLQWMNDNNNFKTRWAPENAENYAEFEAAQDPVVKDRKLRLLRDAVLKEEDAREAKSRFSTLTQTMAVIAVLVANVTYLGWATPPGGSTPYWQGCRYPLFTGFLIVNGVAFMLSASVIVIAVLFPLEDRSVPNRSALVGGIVLTLAIASFLTAFLLSGLVAVNYQAPDPLCAAIACNQGGVKCVPGQVQTDPYNAPLAGIALDPSIATLNGLVGSPNTTVLCYMYAFENDLNQSVAMDAGPGDLQKLQDETIQRQTVCSAARFLKNSVGRYANLTTFPGAAESVAEYKNTTLAAIIAFPGYVAYFDLQYKCQVNDETRTNFLCDTQSSKAVSRSGSFMTLGTLANNGATLINPGAPSGSVWVALVVIGAAGGLVYVICVICGFWKRIAGYLRVYITHS